MIDIDDRDLLSAANEALRRPPDFGYHGDRDMFRSWGLTISQHRDSGTLDRSNYRCIVRDLDAHIESHGCDPDDYRHEVHSSHWAVGWCDQIAVRVLIDEDGEIIPANITGAFRWVADVTLSLAEQYPIYDESDYYDEEYALALEIVTQTIADIRNDAENDVADGVAGARLVPEWVTAEDVLSRMFVSGCETPRENHGQEDETAVAVWELATAEPVSVDQGVLFDL